MPGSAPSNKSEAKRKIETYGSQACKKVCSADAFETQSATRRMVTKQCDEAESISFDTAEAAANKDINASGVKRIAQSLNHKRQREFGKLTNHGLSSDDEIVECGTENELTKVGEPQLKRTHKYEKGGTEQHVGVSAGPASSETCIN